MRIYLPPSLFAPISLCPCLYVPLSPCAHISMCTSTSLSDPKFIYVSKVQYSLGHISMCPHFYVPSSLCAPHLYIPPSLCVPRHLYLPPYLFILADGVKRGAYLCAPISMCPQFFLPSFLCALIFYMLPSLCVS